ncbi:hypothetical protein GCM10027059_38930 [Myceligenerans halotolerans]
MLGEEPAQCFRADGVGWDPADPASGNAWENQAMFGFDDRLLPLVTAELAPDPTR